MEKNGNKILLFMKEKKSSDHKSCKIIFAIKIEFNKHIKSVHKGKRLFECKFLKNNIESKSQKSLRSTVAIEVKYSHLKPEYTFN